MNHYSVWLVPPNPEFIRFSQLIDNLAVENATHGFVPHVTILGGIEARPEKTVENARALAAGLRPYIISLEEVGYTSEFFKCLFVRVKCTAHTLSAYDNAVDIFSASPSVKYKYEPHLSLMYGTFPEHTKERIIRRIGSSFDDRFTVNSLHLYETDPTDVSRWRKIEEIGFGET
jgi:2'-5' RNA ligase